ncbi:MAG: DnaJ domain-containing protein [Candidatus Melainabacteria bacterium]|jgi:curved DNA-binding protein CbpA|nr:DnaJ domain-containing protein [Candidatus Melainabacteria bacterium]
MKSKNEEKTLYEILEVEQGAEEVTIRESYRRLVTLLLQEEESEDKQRKFALLTDAWKVLSDPGDRERYDGLLASN